MERTFNEKSKSSFTNWISGRNLSAAAIVAAAQEMVTCGKLFTDGEHLKVSFIKISEHAFSVKLN